jgi:hypothetical protein
MNDKSENRLGKEAALDYLKKRGIRYTEEEFLRQVVNGRKEIVNVFICAGISPNAALNGETALAYPIN